MKKILQILIGTQIIALYISLFTLIGLRNKNVIIYCVRDDNISCPELRVKSLREIRHEGIYQLDEIDLTLIHKHYVVTYLY